MRQGMFKQHPEVGAALDALAGAISDEDMRRLNFSVDGQHRDAAAVVKEFLQEHGMIN
jgi:glycine betaine/choline ABC-type transport system substrate-binding protein